MPWVYNPHAGGKTIPPQVQARIRSRILAYAAREYGGRYDRIDMRFRGALCYVDAYRDPSDPCTDIDEVNSTVFPDEDYGNVDLLNGSRFNYLACATTPDLIAHAAGIEVNAPSMVSSEPVM